VLLKIWRETYQTEIRKTPYDADSVEGKCVENLRLRCCNNDPSSSLFCVYVGSIAFNVMSSSNNTFTIQFYIKILCEILGKHMHSDTWVREKAKISVQIFHNRWAEDMICLNAAKC
jgi:hypothetical protein